MKSTGGERVFKDALVRGTGKCFTMLATESARRKYRPLVLWACGQRLGYDTQVEGTRALFLYDLIGRYPSPEPFLDVVEKKVFAVVRRFFSPANKSVLESLFMQECDLLTMFAEGGNLRARRILADCYERFSRRLLNLASPSKPDMLVLDSFDNLCGALLSCSGSMEAQPLLERIVKDIGVLCMRNGACDSSLADYFRCLAENRLGEKRYAAMIGRIGPISEVEAYKAAVFQAKKESETWYAKRRRRQNLGYEEVYRQVAEHGTVGIRYMVKRWRLDGRTKDIAGLAKFYVSEKNLETRAGLLDLFSYYETKCEGYLPLDCVLRDAASDDDSLRVSALGVLRSVKDPRVHDFALEMLKKRGVSHELLSVLAGNYRPDDDDFLIGAMKKIGSMRHRVHSILARIPEEKNGDRLSRRMLMHLYDTIECTCCRERVVRELGRRRLLTDDMLAECLHDASDNIRDYAKRLLSRRRANAGIQDGLESCFKRLEMAAARSVAAPKKKGSKA